MADRAERAGMVVGVATVIPRSPVANVDRENIITQQLAETIRDMAGTSERALLDPFEEFITTPNLYQDFYSHDPDDPVGHPNARGYDKLARVFLDVIVGVDSVPPVTGITRPQVGRTQVRPNVRIRMDVWDFGAGIDVQASDMLINGEVVAGASATGNSTRLRFEYSPPQPFTGLVQIGLRSRDRASPANTVDRVVSSFRVAGEALPGDVDEDGRVDGVDLMLLGRSFGATANQVRYLAEADFNRDEVVDGDDLAILAMQLRRGRELSGPGEARAARPGRRAGRRRHAGDRGAAARQPGRRRAAPARAQEQAVPLVRDRVAAVRERLPGGGAPPRRARLQATPHPGAGAAVRQAFPVPHRRRHRAGGGDRPRPPHQSRRRDRDRRLRADRRRAPPSSTASPSAARIRAGAARCRPWATTSSSAPAPW